MSGPAKRRLGIAAAVLGVMAVAGSLAIAWWVKSGGVARSTFAGTSNYALRLEGDGDVEADAAVLRERIALLGIDGEVVAGSGSLEVLLRDTLPAAQLRDRLLQRGDLGFWGVVDDREALEALQVAGGVVEVDANGAYLTSEDVNALGAVAQEDPRLAVEAGELGMPSRLYLLGEQVLDSSNVERATGELGEWGPVVNLEFDAAGRSAFASHTAAHVRERLAIVLDGRVVSAPVVQEPIPGGRAQITLGAGAREPDAVALAAALTTRPLTGDWQVAEERHIGPAE